MSERLLTRLSLSKKISQGNPSANTKLTCGKISDRQIALNDSEAVRLLTPPFTTTIHHPPVISSLPTAPPCLAILSSISNMSQSSEYSNFQALFNAALQDYKDKTGCSLIDHPIAKQLETCQSVSSVTSILQEQAQSFREFKENDGKLKKALNSSVDVLCAPSISSALNMAIGLAVRRKSSTSILFLMVSTAIPACECNIHWLRHLTCRMSLFIRSGLHTSLISGFSRRSNTWVPATTH